MRIQSVRIENLRSFRDVEIPFSQYACLVGANGAGKSTVLCALNVFFRETENVSTDLSQLDQQDFHNKDTENPIKITVCFCELNSEAQRDFADYFRHGKLIVSAVATYNPVAGKAEVKQYGQRLGMGAFKPFFAALGDRKSVPDLKAIYADIRKTFTDLPAPGTKDAMVDALRDYEKNRPEECELIPSEDQFYGVSKGANRLSKYVQWIYVPAVKDASSEEQEGKNTALGRLLSRTVRAKTNFEETVGNLRTAVQDQYEALLFENQHVLTDITTALKARLSDWAHPEATVKLEWRQEPNRSVRVEEPLARMVAGEGSFEGDIARFGHGLQRSYLLALLHELASSNETDGPRLILGCEEPELYQHPPQARHLAAVLQKLAKAKSQIIVSTHSPMFVSGDCFEDVRMVTKDKANRRSHVSFLTYEEVSEAIAAASNSKPLGKPGMLAKIHQALQPAMNEMFFTSKLVLVEGLEDVAYLTSCFHLMDKWEDYRRSGCHIVPVHGKSEMLQPLIIAQKMKIPVFVIFDSDADKQDKSGSRVKSEKDNRALLNALEQATQHPMPSDDVWGPNFVMWHSDIGATIAEDIGATDWAVYQQKADASLGHAGGLRKNTLHIGTCLDEAWSSGKRPQRLQKLCNVLLGLESHAVG